MTSEHRGTKRWAIVILVLMAGIGLGLAGLGATRFDTLEGIVLISSGAVGLVIVLAATVMSLSLIRTRREHSTGEAATRFESLLREIHEHTMLSDNAKRVLYRDRERELLRRTIEQDIARGEYNAGLALCDELAEKFGYRQEAEAFRTRILSARHEHYEASVHAAMDEFDALLNAREWARAHQEAARIRRLFPDSHLIHELDFRIMAARDGHKKELEQQFLDAAQREDVEGAMALLKQLDRYLTREEAQRLQEAAQAVVTKHRKNLEVQFKLAVADRRWAEAARIGEAIIVEFPNTKMAEEVRGMITMIRTRATESALASGRGA